LDSSQRRQLVDENRQMESIYGTVCSDSLTKVRDELAKPHLTETLRGQRKRLGQCEHCGEFLPMSAFGLGDCPRCS
jgi:uncharacterized protein with PIN domain